MKVRKTSNKKPTLAITFEDNDELELFINIFNFAPLNDALCKIRPEWEHLFEYFDEYGDVSKHNMTIARNFKETPWYLHNSTKQ